jgi:osmotically-inducible protein OsmY
MENANDKMVHGNVLDELAFDPRIRHEEIGIVVKDGVVTLSGAIDSNAGRAAAAKAAERVAGVRAVANELQVRLPKNHERNDTEIAHSAVNMLEWAAEVPNERVQIRVEHGWIILQGTVDWHYQRVAAERAVHALLGVKGVSNLIKVQSKVSPDAVKTRIEEAIRRSAEEDAKRVTVESNGTKVILRGRVRTWIERKEAEMAAWNSGVSEVDNRISVGPTAALV